MHKKKNKNKKNHNLNRNKDLTKSLKFMHFSMKIDKEDDYSFPKLIP